MLQLVVGRRVTLNHCYWLTVSMKPISATWMGPGPPGLDNEEESMVPGGVGRSMSCNREGLLDTRPRVASRHRANTAGKSPSANPRQRVRSVQAPRAAGSP